MPSTAASCDSKTRAEPVNFQIDSSTPAVLTTQPSGARLPKRMARPPSTVYAWSTERMQPFSLSVSSVAQRFSVENGWVVRTPPGAAKINTPSLLAASAVQAFGWMVTTAIALYCVRTGNIVQHRRWMIRSYCLATVFTIGRLIIPIPPILAMGDAGVEIVVWSTIALMMFLPNIFLDWRAIVARPKVKQIMATALTPEYSRAA